MTRMDDSDIPTIELDSFSELIQKERPRVYIACSLTNPRELRLLERVINIAQQILEKFGFDVYCPAQHTGRGSPHNDREIYTIDHLQVMRSDLVLFIRFGPSHGMGIEAQIAADLMIPWLDAKLSSFATQLTPMLAGLPNPCGKVRITFSDWREFEKRFAIQLESGISHETSRRVRRARDDACVVLNGIGIGRLIRQQRLLLNMSAEDLARKSGLQAWWIESIERVELLACGLTLAQFARLMNSARLRCVQDQKGLERLAFPRIEPVDVFPPHNRRQAQQFAEYSLRSRLHGEPQPATDKEMLDHWHRWSNNKGKKVAPIPEESVQEVQEPLRAYIAVPMSHLNCVEWKKRENEIREIFKEVQILCGNDLRLEVVLPNYREVGRQESEAQIYLGALSSLIGCDFGILFTSPDAMGVGIIAQLLANANLPALYVAERKARLSRMLCGEFNQRIGDVIRYDRFDELPALISQVLCQEASLLRESADISRHIRDRVKRCSLKRVLDRYRIPRRISFENCRKKFREIPFLRSEWLKALVDKPELQCTMTLIQIVHIASSMGWRIGLSTTGIPSFHLPCLTEETANHVPEYAWPAADETMQNLLDALDYLDHLDASNLLPLYKIRDKALFDHWSRYSEGLQQVTHRRDLGDLVVSKEEWIQLIKSGLQSD